MTDSSRTRSNSRTSATSHSDGRSVHRGDRNRRPAELLQEDTPSHWFPVWAPALVMLAVIFTGLVLAKGDATIPTSFFALFAVAMIICTVFVEPRGLFLSAASFPLFYLFGSLAIGWFSSGATTIASKKTKVITSIYPAIEHFLWLLIPFLVAVGIAIFRWWNYRENLTRKAARLEMQRRRRSESDRSNIETYGRAKERSQARSQARRGNRSIDDAPSEEPAQRSTQAEQEEQAHRSKREGTRIPRGGNAVPAPYQTGFDQDEEFLRPHSAQSSTQRSTQRSGASAKRVTRSSDQLRDNARRRRVPLPERRMSPQRYLDDDHE